MALTPEGPEAQDPTALRAAAGPQAIFPGHPASLPSIQPIHLWPGESYLSMLCYVPVLLKHCGAQLGINFSTDIQGGSC